MRSAWALVTLLATGCQRGPALATAPAKVTPVAPAERRTPVPPNSNPFDLPIQAPPAANESAQWLGPALPEGQWVEEAGGWLITGRRAAPGARFRVAVESKGSGSPHLCVVTGKVDPDETDLDDAVPLKRRCVEPNRQGLSEVVAVLPREASAIWLIVRGDDAPGPFRLRLDSIGDRPGRPRLAKPAGGRQSARPRTRSATPQPAAAAG